MDKYFVEGRLLRSVACAWDWGRKPLSTCGPSAWLPVDASLRSSPRPSEWEKKGLGRRAKPMQKMPNCWPTSITCPTTKRCWAGSTHWLGNWGSDEFQTREEASGKLLLVGIAHSGIEGRTQ